MPLMLRVFRLIRLPIAVAAVVLVTSVCLLFFVAPVSSAERASPAAALQWTPPVPGYRIYVDSDGIYRLDNAYLTAAGLPVDSVDPATFRIFYMGEEIPIRVEDGGDGRFDPGDAVFFYGRSVDSLFLDGLLPTDKYTASSVFWLTYGGATGLRMADRPSASGGDAALPHPRRTHIERQYWYRSARPMLPNADHWFADPLQSGAFPAERSYSFTDASLPAGSHTASCRSASSAMRADRITSACT